MKQKKLYELIVILLCASLACVVSSGQVRKVVNPFPVPTPPASVLVLQIGEFERELK